MTSVYQVEVRRPSRSEDIAYLVHSSVAVNVLNCVPQKQKLLHKSVKFMIISYSARPYVILNQLLPSVSAAAENYNLRPRKHNRLLPERANFIYRNLYCDIY